MTINRPLGDDHSAYARAAEEREMRGLMFEIASVRSAAGSTSDVLSELLLGWNAQAQAITARYFDERESCLGCGQPAYFCGYESAAASESAAIYSAAFVARAAVRAKLRVCADCESSPYRDAFLDAIDERAETEVAP